MRHEIPHSLCTSVSVPPDLSAPVPALQNATLPPSRSALIADTTLPYGSGHRTGFCRLRIFAPGGGGASRPALILVTEAPENQGLSITNGIEIIATQVCRHYGLKPQHAILIEHYDDRDRGSAARLPGRIEGEKFSCITFETLQPQRHKPGIMRLQRPQWQPVEKGEVEALIGAPLP